MSDREFSIHKCSKMFETYFRISCISNAPSLHKWLCVLGRTWTNSAGSSIYLGFLLDRVVRTLFQASFWSGEESYLQTGLDNIIFTSDLSPTPCFSGQHIYHDLGVNKHSTGVCFAEKSKLKAGTGEGGNKTGGCVTS